MTPGGPSAQSEGVIATPAPPAGAPSLKFNPAKDSQLGRHGSHRDGLSILPGISNRLQIHSGGGRFIPAGRSNDTETPASPFPSLFP